MKYTRLNSEADLDISFNGPSLDLYAMGVFHLNLQEIVDKVAYGLLAKERALPPVLRHRPYYLAPPYYRGSPPLIKSLVASIKVGSLYETVSFVVATVLADQNSIAILNNLASDVIWAVGKSGIEGVRRSNVDEMPEVRRDESRLPDDVFEIGPNLRDTITALADSGHNGAVLKLSSKRTKTTEAKEVEIWIDPNNGG
ncbi:hypothetical protein RMSM_01529 [Rhodopirellula maiorica SM1]|uniref:Uncharacterized protein n=1 Tax=Rhodopirellula maiorica SM1 TaxID=1265738 RepID=M5RQH8_9BACT|nr:hypothetical protein [Rhodopirellula maiorica]EMI21550.1 hypothetical protein RMSM_01529 [Rhodopirellula maiorica SM1]